MTSRHRNDGSRGDGSAQVSLRRVLSSLKELHGDESGATATEYVVLLVLVAAAIIAIIAAFGEQIERLYNQAVEVLRRDVANQ